jgi:hypothetical protein
VETEGSLPHSQVPATYPYPEPAQSSPYPHIPLITWRSILNLMSLFCWSGRTKVSVQIRGFVCEYFVTKIIFHGEEFLPRLTPKLEDHTLSAVQDCLFNIFAATLHIGGRSSIRNLRMRHAVVTRTHLSHGIYIYIYIYINKAAVFCDTIYSNTTSCIIIQYI